MESTLSSKVTGSSRNLSPRHSCSDYISVEYHDPSGIFPLISRDLASRLPLRNLNWKSPSRPLRSIGALHVEFVPDAQTEASESDKLQRVDSYGSRAGAPSVAKERRHQIPGLRQTPYLRIYLLRCDDKDTYKASSRQLLRDWLRDTAPPSQSSSNVNKSEDHDAAEWLILHVVIPDTIAASEPRWTAASKKEPDELVERPSSTTKWPGKSTRTVLDKIRADFTASSKSGPERIAQIRLQKKDVPPQLLPQTPVTQPYIESPQEQENAWQDLIAKFKTLILMSFDLRVSQYEDDIREKDSQRALPGWNFCTFFTLKEGLARGFESVGLVEDALAIYDELSAGLDSALRDNEPGAAQGTFLGNLDDQKNSLQEIVGAQSGASKLEQLTSQFQEMFDQPLDLTKKDYRGAIVSSTISLFDFRLYIFARQRTLLLRLGAGSGNLQQARPSSTRGGPKDDNLTYAAEVCKRAALFAATNARALRNGLTEGYGYILVLFQIDLFVDSCVGLTTILIFHLLLRTSLLLGRMLYLIRCSVRLHRRTFPLLVREPHCHHKTKHQVSYLRKRAISTFLKEQILIQIGQARYSAVCLLLHNLHRKLSMRTNDMPNPALAPSQILSPRVDLALRSSHLVGLNSF